MRKKIDTEEIDKRFNGKVSYSFPHAPKTPKQQEEQAFYEAHSCDDCIVFYIWDKLWAGIKAIGTISKSKSKIE